MSSCRPIYRRYDGQCQAQDAYLEISEDGALECSWNAEIGNATPCDVCYGVTMRFSISNSLTQQSINNLVREIRPLAQKLLETSDCHFNSQSNYARDRFDDEEQEIVDEIEKICEQYDDREVEGCWECGCDYCYSESNGKCGESDCPDCSEEE
jgi:hypothetical protein